MSKTKTPQPACPECEKLSAVSEKYNQIWYFLDWVESWNGAILVTRYEDDGDDGNLFTGYDRLSHHEIEKLIAEYFEIDMDKVKKERMALLKWLRDTKAFETCTCHSYPNVMSADCKVHAEEIFEND